MFFTNTDYLFLINVIFPCLDCFLGFAVILIVSNSCNVNGVCIRFGLEDQYSIAQTLSEKLLTMDHYDLSMKKKISALLRVINVTRSYKEDDKEPCKIEDGLFLGSIGAAGNKDELKRLNVTHILTVANSLVPAHPDDFVYKIVPVKDREETNMTEYFEECFDFIDEAKGTGSGGVLVHCFAGISRSVTIVVAYLMKKRGLSLSQALKNVKSRRPKASPNNGFMLQLQDYQNSLESNSGEKTD